MMDSQLFNQEQEESFDLLEDTNLNTDSLNPVNSLFKKNMGELIDNFKDSFQTEHDSSLFDFSDTSPELISTFLQDTNNNNYQHDINTNSYFKANNFLQDGTGDKYLEYINMDMNGIINYQASNIVDNFMNEIQGYQPNFPFFIAQNDLAMHNNQKIRNNLITKSKSPLLKDDPSQIFNPKSKKKNLNEIKEHNCISCNLKFKRFHDLQRHIQTHSNSKSFICEKCGKGFTRKDALQRHKNNAEVGKGVCKTKSPVINSSMFYPTPNSFEQYYHPLPAEYFLSQNNTR